MAKDTLKKVNQYRGALGGLGLLIIVGSGAILRRIPQADKLQMTLAVIAVVGLAIFFGKELERLQNHK